MRTIVFLLLVVAGLQLVPSGAQAQDQTVTVSIDSLNLSLGEEGSVDVEVVGYPEPGLDAWTIHISYDPQTVSVIQCEPAGNAICDPAYREATVRITGAEANALVGDFSLATIRFRCEDAGTSPLRLTLQVFGDAIGDPADPSPEVDMRDAGITCAAAPSATQDEPPNETPVPVLPRTGTGSSVNESLVGWPVAGVLAVGGAVLAGWAAGRRIRSG